MAPLYCAFFFFFNIKVSTFIKLCSEVNLTDLFPTIHHSWQQLDNAGHLSVKDNVTTCLCIINIYTFADIWNPQTWTSCCDSCYTASAARWRITTGLWRADVSSPVLRATLPTRHPSALSLFPQFPRSRSKSCTRGSSSWATTRTRYGNPGGSRARGRSL